jgi:hypothetical protein
MIVRSDIVTIIPNTNNNTMTAQIAPLPGLNLAALTGFNFERPVAKAAPTAKLSTVSVAAPAMIATMPLPSNEPRINRLLRFRAQHPEAFENRRIQGMKNSSLVRENLMRLHREKKAEWRASALRNPKLQATDQHIAAKQWVLRAPDGATHTFRNLKKWVRENPDLFAAEDVIWKEMNGKANQAWCRAFQALGRLRPTSSKHLPEWQGWTWAGDDCAAERAAWAMAAAGLAHV